MFSFFSSSSSSESESEDSISDSDSESDLYAFSSLVIIGFCFILLEKNLNSSCSIIGILLFLVLTGVIFSFIAVSTDSSSESSIKFTSSILFD